MAAERIHRRLAASPTAHVVNGGKKCRLCLVKTWSSRLAARWSRTDVGDLVPESSGDPWSPLEMVTQHVKWDAAMVVEHECEQLRCRVEWHAGSVARARIIPNSDYALGLGPAIPWGWHRTSWPRVAGKPGASVGLAPGFGTRMPVLGPPDRGAPGPHAACIPGPDRRQRDPTEGDCG